MSAGPDRAPARGPSWATLGVLSACLLVVQDLLIPSAAVATLGYAATALALAAGFGLVHGLLLGGLTAGLGRLSPLLRALAWLVVGAFFGLWLAESLGAIERLDSPYRDMALRVLAACGVAGLGVTTLFLALQPERRPTALTGEAAPAASRLGRALTAGPHGWVGARGPRLRAAFGLSCLVAVPALVWADRTLFVGGYEPAHVALRLVALWCLLAAGVVLDRARPLPRLGVKTAPVVAIAALVPFVLLTPEHGATLQAFATRPLSSALADGARALVDLDGDGHAALLGGGDCAEGEPSVNPGADEVPGNGVDDNCVLGDATLEGRRGTPDLRPEALPPIPTAPSPMNVVLITVDTVTPFRMSLHEPSFREPGRQTTPNIDAWAQDAVVFDRGYATGGMTTVTFPSLMRGVYPRTLEWVVHYEVDKPPAPDQRLVLGPPSRWEAEGYRVALMWPLAMRDPRPTLAQWLQRRGMTTVAVTDDSHAEVLSPDVGADAGFDRWHETDSQPEGGRGDRGTADLAVAAIQALAADQPFFLWVHFFGPHAPNHVHEGVPTFGDPDSLEGGYDHELAHVDAQVGRVLEALEAHPASGRTAVFLTSDHGEVFDDVWRHHGYDLSEEVVRVPLVAKVPGWSPRREARVASLVDLVPTVLSLTDTPAPDWLDGVDWTRWDRDPGADAGRIVLSETFKFRRDGTPSLDFVAAYDGTRKAVLDRTRAAMTVQAPQAPGVPERRLTSWTSDPLAVAILEYLESVGGSLRVRR